MLGYVCKLYGTRGGRYVYSTRGECVNAREMDLSKTVIQFVIVHCVSDGALAKPPTAVRKSSHDH